MPKKVRPFIIVIENSKDVVPFGEGILKNINKGCSWRRIHSSILFLLGGNFHNYVL